MTIQNLSGSTLILNLACPRTQPKSTDTPRFKPYYLKILFWTISRLGYTFSTVSEALSLKAKNSACLTIDGPIINHLTPVLWQIKTWDLPLTLFLSTKSINQNHQDWEAVKKLLSPKWEIGSQGHSLMNMTVKSHADQLRSISRSTILIKKYLGFSPKVFAYPYGAYDATTVRCLRQLSYKAAVTNLPGINSNEQQEPYHLRRVTLSGKLLKDIMLLVNVWRESGNHSILFNFFSSQTEAS